MERNSAAGLDTKEIFAAALASMKPTEETSAKKFEEVVQSIGQLFADRVTETSQLADHINQLKACTGKSAKSIMKQLKAASKQLSLPCESHMYKMLRAATLVSTFHHLKDISSIERLAILDRIHPNFQTDIFTSGQVLGLDIRSANRKDLAGAIRKLHNKTGKSNAPADIVSRAVKKLQTALAQVPSDPEHASLCKGIEEALDIARDAIESHRPTQYLLDCEAPGKAENHTLTSVGKKVAHARLSELSNTQEHESSEPICIQL